MINLVKPLKYLAILACFIALTLLSGPVIVPETQARYPFGSTIIVPPCCHIYCPDEAYEVWCMEDTIISCQPAGAWFCLP